MKCVIGVEIFMKKPVKPVIAICAIVFILLIAISALLKLLIINNDISVNSEYVVFLEGKREISLIHASDTELHFFAVNEAGLHNLYTINFLDNEIVLVDYDIHMGIRTQYSDGYIYYTKTLELEELSRQQRFRRVGVTGGSPENVAAVIDVYVKEQQRTLSSVLAANGSYFTSMSHQNPNGNWRSYLVRIEPCGEASIISDFMFPSTGFTWYNNHLFFSGINLSEDGVFVVPDEGGTRRRLHTGPTTILAAADGRLFFSSGRFHDGIIDINYIHLYGCQKVNLFTGELSNVVVLGEWVYFIDIENSSKIKKININTRRIHYLTATRVQDFIINDSGTWLYYQRAYLMGSQILRLPIVQTEFVCPGTPGVIVCFGEMIIHWDDGITKYGSRAENNRLALYAIDSRSSNKTQLAVFEPLNISRWGGVETEWCNPSWIHYFEVVGDWVIISVGETMGSGGFFEGGIFRVKRDGSRHEPFEFGTYNPRFIIFDDWIYHNDWVAMDGEGWFRIRPDGTGKELLDAAIHNIYFFSEDGYVYNSYKSSDMLNEWNPIINLVRWRPDSGEFITLFTGTTLPEFDDSCHMGFWDIVVTDNYVLFTVFVWGYRDGDSWRGSLLYTADYRVDKDGNNLILLNEEFH